MKTEQTTATSTTMPTVDLGGIPPCVIPPLDKEKSENPAFAETLTYGDFRQELRAWLGEKGMADSTVDNYLSGLTLWMELQGRQDSDFVGNDLGENRYREALGRAVTTLDHPAEGEKEHTDATKNSRKSQFEALRNCYYFLSLSNDVRLNFNRIVRVACEKKGLNPIEVFVRAGVRPTTAANWMHPKRFRNSGKHEDGGTRWQIRGTPLLDHSKVPQRREQIERVEDLLGLPRATLTRLCSSSAGCWRRRKKPRELSPQGKRLQSVCKDRYRLKLTGLEKCTPEFMEQHRPLVAALLVEINAYKEYKTHAFPEQILKLKRHKKGKWRVHEKTNRCPCMEGFTSHCELLCGYALKKHSGTTSLPLNLETELRVNPEEPRKHIKPPLTPSIAWFADLKLLIGFMEFQKMRGGGFYSNSALLSLQRARTLAHTEFGYLTQQADEFGPKVGKTPEEFRQLCKEMHQFCNTQFETMRPMIKMSRNPKVPIQRILDKQHPLEAVFLLLDEMNKALPTIFGGRQAQLALERDIAMVALLASNPLRVSHFSSMRYKEGDDTANLYRRGDRLFLRFERESFKNFAGAARHYDYDYPVARFAEKWLNNYLDKSRNEFGWGEDMDLVFPNCQGNAHGPRRQERTITRRLQELTFAFIPQLAPYGFGAHAFRHIVATEFIKNDPAGMEVAARVLHDTLRSIREAYSDVKGVDHAKIYTDYSDAVHKQYKQD
jgi:integrase